MKLIHLNCGREILKAFPFITAVLNVLVLKKCQCCRQSAQQEFLSQARKRQSIVLFSVSKWLPKSVICQNNDTLTMKKGSPTGIGGL